MYWYSEIPLQKTVMWSLLGRLLMAKSIGRSMFLMFLNVMEWVMVVLKYGKLALSKQAYDR